ncbi:trimethyllysine dioxygenase, mitochondrial-like isoform X1 [Pleurodeles waltl]|uniref:trimethyllysine dioxygenase, mitochondrial-like isoform X1 n=1 Tax=Pleurodeles waltl TaxID=8319 RepID=UPI003709B099
MWCVRMARVYAGTQWMLKKGVGPRAPSIRTLSMSAHLPSTDPKPVPCTWHLHDKHFELQYGDSCMRFDFVWLRDNCRSNSCHDSEMNQRILDTASVDLNIKPTHVQVDDSTLHLTWPDGHLTDYSLSWLMENSYEGHLKKPQLQVLWNAEVYQRAQVAPVPCQRVLETDEGLRELFDNFLRYGFALVDGVPPTEEDTEHLAQRVSLVREAFLGRCWSVTSDFAGEDVDLTTDSMDSHTGGSSMHEPFSIIVFHCQKHDGVGGRTVLVDGFYAAKQIQQRNPEDWDILQTVPVRHEYIGTEQGIRTHMTTEAPLLSVHPGTQELRMVRYKNIYRCPIVSVPHDVVHRWYQAHRSFTNEVRKPENQLLIELNPGMVLFVDNWRLLHGRETFTGYRRVIGYFLFRDDLLGKARLLGMKV